MAKQETQRKTLRDYLLNGRAIGRYFATNKEPTLLGISCGGYMVKGICPAHNSSEVTDLIVVPISSEKNVQGQIFLGEHLDDKEILPSELEGIIKIFKDKQLNRTSR